MSGTRVCSRTNRTSSGRRTKLSATMSTPMRWPARRCSRSSSGTAGSGVDRPGDVQALARGDDPADLDARVDLALARAHRGDPQPHRRRRRGRGPRPAPSRRRSRPRRPTCALASPSSSPSAPQKVTRLPGSSSTRSSRRTPMRSLGPGRSCRIATGRPARPAASRTRCAVSACCSCVPWLKFSRATSMPGLDHPHEDLADRGRRGRSWRRSSCGASRVTVAQRRDRAARRLRRVDGLTRGEVLRLAGGVALAAALPLPAARARRPAEPGAAGGCARWRPPCAGPS